MKESKIYPPLQKMAFEQTLRGLYAMNAPDVPDWFEYLSSEYPYVAAASEDRYFIWRWYYADKMIEQEVKK